MIEFGLIGRSLKHSFSKKYFEKKFLEQNLINHSYSLFELSAINQFPDLIKDHPHLYGLNVTLPYKESILPYLDFISPDAQEIGAVNCLLINNNKIIGHNTDAYGFAQSIKPFLDSNHERALILGSGGSSKAVAFVLKKIGVEVYFVTSSQKKTENTFFYHEINPMVMNAFKLVVNCTPLGMFPNMQACPTLPYTCFTKQHLAVDLIYNPEETLFLKQAKAAGSMTLNGLSMLNLQAEKSWELWQVDKNR